MSVSENSALFWLPRVTDRFALDVPDTLVVSYDHREAVAAIEDGLDWPAWPGLVEEVWAAVRVVGPPAFIRTDLASAKHDGPSSYRASSRGEVEQVLSLTIQDNEIKFWPAGPYPCAFLVREWIDLPAPFRAFGGSFEGHPIAREWRYFATGAEVVCKHFYWPEEAISGADLEGWREALAELAAAEPPAELDAEACMAAELCATDDHGEWSVDFAQARDGTWYLIDMATALSSWHPEHRAI